MSDTIDYGNLMHTAMRGLIQKVLLDVAKAGLPGQHHFFITFDTTHPEVELADWLADRFPEDMTIVMQHWFDNLDVTDDGFSVTLNFGDQPEAMYIPYDAIRTFVDPSVEFGLRFETQDEDDEEETEEAHDLTEVGLEEIAPIAEDVEPDETPQDAEVVSLDSFRK
ncbi:ClpXP protease specificity-enhancing factor SspB [Aliiroseovarius subalbicans]|uniref:SspB family protein n=1 Tax=Aliiroseovarius subalbicans TaxID=2925840 RepID=UPI001F56B4F3|nr:ClpXP protease specificity-enhancing factor SspB [Aliiroseovarius subalbicans]MCI2398539.1 ClpXP protease specificity-enhancing factor SspB [Aliiroseovarius subalbicans]